MATKLNLVNISLRAQVLLERLKTHEAQKVASVFAQIDKSTAQLLEAMAQDGIGKATKKELGALLAALSVENTKLLTKQTDQLFDTLKELAGHDADIEAQSFKEIGVKRKIVTPDYEAAFNYARQQPVSATGQLLETFVNEWTKGEVNRINDVTRKAWGEGWTNQELTRAIRGTKANSYKDGILATSRRNAEAITRTSMQHTSSTGRMATWDANSDIVVGYKYVATLDTRTTIICRSLDGKVFKRGEGPVPPVHINCRSRTVAELDKSLGLDFLDEGATRASIDGQVPADMTYYSWLKTQDVDFQKTALGATRAKLFRDGGLSADKFAALNLGRNFQPLTLDEMRKKAPLVFKKAGLGNN